MLATRVCTILLCIYVHTVMCCLPTRPCDCDPLVVYPLRDTMLKGDEIVKFTSTTNLAYAGACAHSTIENNSMILQLQLRDPCFQGDVPSCLLNCGTNTVRVVLHIDYVDLYPPAFPKPVFNVTISEDLKLNETVFDFNKAGHSPSDPDCESNPSFTYSFYQNQDGDGNFYLLGDGYLKLKTAVDYESTKEYTMTIQVRNGDKTNTTVINVMIGDVDDNDPEFDYLLGYVLKVEEEATALSLTTTPSLLCRDVDTGINQAVLYSFKDYVNTTDFLTIHSYHGTFDVTQSLDREQNSSYVLELWCFQNDTEYKRAITTLQIEVIDINDNLAIFEPTLYDVTLVENAIGYVTTVMATDADIGDNAVMLYEMVDGPQSNILNVDAYTGIVTIGSPADLDREKIANITVQIRAKDLDGNYSSNTATVVITLLDINDNSPEFELPFYLFNLNATHNTGIIGQVKATDEDEQATPNSNVTYELYQGTANVPFNMVELTGEIETTDTINSTVDYNIIVQACDNPVYANDRRCNIVNVRVVYGKNLTFSSHEVYIEVSENVPIETRIGETLPITGEMYTSSMPEFNVDASSSLLVTKTPLDRETNDTYYINIDVYEYNRLKGNITVTINITDINDNAPVFTHTEYYLTIPHSAGKNVLLGTLHATDKDVGFNAKLTYRFKSIYSDQFRVSSESGEVFTSSVWKDHIDSGNILYHVIVEVEDHGVPMLNAVVPVYISAMVSKDNNVVGIPTSLTKNAVMQNSSKTSMETQMADLLGFDLVQITGMEEESSLMYINASVNGTVAPSITLQRSVVENWSPIQDMFRQLLEPRELSTDDTTLSAAEIALIAVSLVIMLGSGISIVIICRQWNQHVKNHKLYDSLRRPSNLYDSQELTMNFGDEVSSRLNTFNSNRRMPQRTAPDNVLEGSFGLGMVNSGFVDNDEHAPKTPTWSTGDTPRIPRWSTSDSIKDAMLSLEELTTRLNSEDNISRVSNISRSRQQSLKSNYSESQSDKIPNGFRQSTPRTNEYENLKLTPRPSNNSVDLNAEEHEDRTEEATDQGETEGNIEGELMATDDDHYVVSDTVPVISGDNTIKEEATAF